MYLPKLIKKILKEQYEYRGMHGAPHASDDYSSPIYDMTNAYGEDIYGSNAVRYFGTGDPNDHLAVSIIQRLRNKPNATLKIYRSVPDFDYEIKKEIKLRSDIISYYLKFGFFPMKNKMNSKQIEIMNDLDKKYDWVKDYDENNKKIFDDLQNQIQELIAKKQPTTKINDGDWVTTVKQYAVDHGRSHLNGKFKILSKTVKAKNVYGNGDSVMEFGYSA